jgi:hypothetical protein
LHPAHGKVRRPSLRQSSSRPNRTILSPHPPHPNTMSPEGSTSAICTLPCPLRRCYDGDGRATTPFGDLRSPSQGSEGQLSAGPARSRSLTAVRRQKQRLPPSPCTSSPGEAGRRRSPRQRPAALEGGLENAAGDLTFYRNLPPGGSPPPKAPEGHGPIPPNCLITLRNPGHKMNLF